MSGEVVQTTSIQKFLKSDAVSSRIEAVLKDKAETFVSSLITLASMDANLQRCNPGDVYREAMKAGTLDLPLEKSFNFAFIIAYNEKDKGMTPHFQMGYKGWIQLALRTGTYKKMNAVTIKQGELKFRDIIREEYEFEFIQDAEKRAKLPAVGFAFYFQTINGFEKLVYMTKDECIQHGKKYSKSFNNVNGLWKTDPDAMCLKTVILQGLTKWGMVSATIQGRQIINEALKSDDDYTGDELDDGLDENLEIKIPEEPEAGPKPVAEEDHRVLDQDPANEDFRGKKAAYVKKDTNPRGTPNATEEFDW